MKPVYRIMIFSILIPALASFVVSRMFINHYNKPAVYIEDVRLLSDSMVELTADIHSKYGNPISENKVDLSKQKSFEISISILESNGYRLISKKTRK